jgi:hypothetical protein
MQLTKQQLLNAGPKRKAVTLEGVGDVTVRQFTAKETLRFLELQKAEKHDAVIAHIIQCGVCDEDGAAMFAKLDEIHAFMASASTEHVSKICEEVLTISKLKKPETADEKKADAETSDATTSNDSSTA